MGYYSSIRFATTKKGYEKIKDLVQELYGTELRKRIDKAKSVKWDDDHKHVTLEEEKGFHSIYSAMPIWEGGVFATTQDGKYVLFGFDDVKWLGYNHMERQCYEKAFEKCGEPVKYLAIGEDGAIEKHFWGEEDYDMPYLETLATFDYSSEWES